MTRHLGAGLIGLFLLACVVLGGASRAGFAANFALQILALGFLGWGLVQLEWLSLQRQERYLLVLAGVFLLLTGLQFVPLPLGVWESLPGRGVIASELALLGAAPDPGFLTLSLHESVRSVAALLPLLAVGIAILVMRAKPVVPIAATIVGATLIALALGIMQFLAGQQSPLYFYDFTNRGYMVGFFANANHMATLILIAIPFIAALLRHGRDQFPEKKNEFTVLGLALMGLYAIGVALVGSMTGFALLLPVTFASALIIWPMAQRKTMFIAAPAILISLTALIAFGDGLIGAGGEIETSQAGRTQIFRTAWPALMDFFPVGSGLGTFEEIFRRYEDESAVTRTFINHAHNDYLELVIELGLPGLLLIGSFIAWWLSCLKRLATPQASPYAWAGWIAIGVVLTHSAWDYPLRTAAISAIFSVCCVLACASLPPTRNSAEKPTRSRRPVKEKLQI